MKKLFLLTILACVAFSSFSQKQTPRRIKDVTDIVVGDESVNMDGIVIDCFECLWWVGKMNECTKKFNELKMFKDSLTMELELNNSFITMDEAQTYIRKYEEYSRTYKKYYGLMNEHHDVHYYVERDIDKAAMCSVLQGSMIQIFEDLMEKCKPY